MAELTTLARPYARAAFEFALEADALERWLQTLDTAAALLGEPAVARLIGDPGRTATAKAEALGGLLDDSQDPAVSNFLQLLAHYQRLALLPQIREVFVLMKANHEKRIELEVTSAFDIDAAQAERLARAMEQRLKRQVTVRTAVDRELIGGALIRTGDLVVDGTVRGKLAKLAEAMHS